MSTTTRSANRPFDAHSLNDLTEFPNTSPSRCLFLTSPPISSGRLPVRVTEPGQSGRKQMLRQGHHSSAAPNTVLQIGNNNSYLVKRNTGGGVQFSRDPLNLMNKNSRKVRTA